jgi:hypothetical protein
MLDIILIVAAALVVYDWYRGWPWAKAVKAKFGGD